LPVIERPSPNVDARPPGTTVDTLILHYTGMRSAEAALARLTDPAAKVSAHYLIDEAGRLFRLVPEEARAWHAGVSSWQGRSGLNHSSIGIEIANPGHDWGYRPFTEAQYRTLEALCPAIMARWPIPAARVLAHSDVAPERKEDPGELFDWQRLARLGIGIWPAAGDGASRPVADLQAGLGAVGYAVPNHGELDRATRTVLTAFQRHFRPERVDGAPDRGTLARLDGLLRLPSAGQGLSS
jgi:N-acetylmuramoyl-L-alanine amidase